MTESDLDKVDIAQKKGSIMTEHLDAHALMGKADVDNWTNKAQLNT
jgi:hypothetical protein